MCPDECCVLLDDSRFDGFVDIHVNNVPYQSVIIFSAHFSFSKTKKMGNFGKSFLFLIQNLTNFAIVLEKIAKFSDATKLKKKNPVSIPMVVLL